MTRSLILLTHDANWFIYVTRCRSAIRHFEHVSIAWMTKCPFQLLTFALELGVPSLRKLSFRHDCVKILITWCLWRLTLIRRSSLFFLHISRCSLSHIRIQDQELLHIFSINDNSVAIQWHSLIQTVIEEVWGALRDFVHGQFPNDWSILGWRRWRHLARWCKFSWILDYSRCLLVWW